MLGFEIFIRCIRNSFNFTGSLCRKDFIIFTIWEIILSFIVVIMIQLYMGDNVVVILLYTTTLIVVNFPAISAAFRRFHDSGSSYSWLILNYMWSFSSTFIKNNLNPTHLQIRFIGGITLGLSLYILYVLIFKPTKKSILKMK